MKNLTINKFVETYGGDIWNICTHFYLHYIKDKSKEDSLYNLIYFLSNEPNSDSTIVLEQLYSIEAYDEVLNEVYRFMNKVVNNLVKSNPDENTFYGCLLEKINDNTIFESDIKKSVAIMSLKINRKIPYFELGERLTLDDDDYNTIINSKILITNTLILTINNPLFCCSL